MTSIEESIENGDFIFIFKLSELYSMYMCQLKHFGTGKSIPKTVSIKLG